MPQLHREGGLFVIEAILPNFEIACHDMDTKLGATGLLGMNFLNHFRMEVDFHTGEIFRIKN